MKSKILFCVSALALWAAATSASAAIFAVETRLHEINPRPGWFHVTIVPADVSKMTSGVNKVSCPNSARLNAPLFYSTDTDAKTLKQTMMLAIATKTRVRLLFDTTVACADGGEGVANGYPKIFAADLLVE